MKMKKTDFLAAVEKRNGKVLRKHCEEFLASEDGKQLLKDDCIENPSGVVQHVIWLRRGKEGVSAETLEDMTLG